MTTEKILNSYTIRQLKKEISKTNIKGYSKMKRAELHAIIVKNKQRFSHLTEQTKAPPKVKAKPKAKPPTNKPKPAPKPKPKPKTPTPKKKTPTPKPKTPPSKLAELKKKFNSFPASKTKVYKDAVKKKNWKLLGQPVTEEEWYKAVVGLLEGLVEDTKKKAMKKAKKKTPKKKTPTPKQPSPSMEGGPSGVSDDSSYGAEAIEALKDVVKQQNLSNQKDAEVAVMMAQGSLPLSLHEKLNIDISVDLSKPLPPKAQIPSFPKGMKGKSKVSGPSPLFKGQINIEDAVGAASAVPLKAGDYVPKPVKIPADFDKERGSDGGYYGGGRYSNFTFGITYSFNFTDFAVPNPNKIPGDKFYGTDSYYFGQPVLPPPPGAKLSQPQPKYYVENTGTARDTVLGPYDVPFKFTDYMKKQGIVYLGMAEMPTYEFYKKYAGNAPNQFNKEYKGAKQVQFFKKKNFEGNNKPKLLVWLQNGEYFKTRVFSFQYFRTDFNKGKFFTLQNVNSSPKLAEFKSWLSTLK